MTTSKNREQLILETASDGWCLSLPEKDQPWLKSAVSWRIDGCDYSSTSPLVTGRKEDEGLAFQGPGFASRWKASVDEQGRFVLSMSITNVSERVVSLEALRPIWAKAVEGNGLFAAQGELRRPVLENTWVLTDDWERINHWNVRCKPVQENEALISPWNVFVYEKTQGAGFFAGALDRPVTFSRFDLLWRKQKKSLDFSLEADCRLGRRGLSLDPGETFEMERYVLWYEPTRSPQELLRKATQYVATSLSPRKQFTERVFGYCDWYWAFGNITDERMAANQMALIKEFGDTFKWIQLDDGWQTPREPGYKGGNGGPWGANSKFPGGIKAFSKRAKADGMTPGVWLRPLMLDPDSEPGRSHPEWYLDRDARILDPTVPEVLEYIRETITQLVHKDGIGYLKIDFLAIDFIGLSGHGKDFMAWPRDGFRHRSGTGMQALRKVSEVIRGAAGEDVFILGCTVHPYPHVDLYDGFRTSNDVCPWDFSETIEHSIAATFHRAHQHGVLYHADPDCIVVRDPYTIDEARLWAGLVAVSGQMCLLGEDLVNLPESRKEILRTLKPYFTEMQGGYPLDLFRDPWPRLWYVPEARTLGVFNYRDEDYRVSLDLDALELDLPETPGVDLWTGKTVTPRNGRLDLEEVPHGTAIYQF